ncbi:MAG: nucleotidyltransferase domain-containing protein [Ignavibacteriaceae bacterium]|nr:nucleotidyltransferase domain-containing protein [Ignavibacteriaceae bacterium]
METTVIRNKIEYSEIIQRILQEVEVEKVILFGSRARGDNKPESDLDLLIIQKDDFSKNKSRWNETIKIRKALKDFIIPKDILLFSEAEVDYWKDSLNHIIPTCLREGKVLYARS